jgi:hypothetical protein
LGTLFFRTRTLDLITINTDLLWSDVISGNTNNRAVRLIMSDIKSRSGITRIDLDFRDLRFERTRSINTLVSIKMNSNLFIKRIGRGETEGRVRKRRGTRGGDRTQKKGRRFH